MQVADLKIFVNTLNYFRHIKFMMRLISSFDDNLKRASFCRILYINKPIRRAVTIVMITLYRPATKAHFFRLCHQSATRWRCLLYSCIYHHPAAVVPLEQLLVFPGYDHVCGRPLCILMSRNAFVLGILWRCFHLPSLWTWYRAGLSYHLATASEVVGFAVDDWWYLASF